VTPRLPDIRYNFTASGRRGAGKYIRVG